MDNKAHSIQHRLHHISMINDDKKTSLERTMMVYRGKLRLAQKCLDLRRRLCRQFCKCKKRTII